MKVWWVLLILAEVAAAEAQEPGPDPLEGGSLGPGSAHMIKGKWREIIVPSIEFANTPVEDAVEYLRQKSVELDTIEKVPERKGINVVFKTSPGWSAGRVSLDDERDFSFEGRSPRVTMTMKMVPIGDALRIVAELAGLEARIDGYAAVIGPPAEDVSGLTKSIPSAGAAVSGWKEEDLYAGSAEVPFPATSLLEALQSEYRKMKISETRSGADAAEREALAARIKATQRAIEQARSALLEYWRAEREIAAAWTAETAG